MQFIPKYNNEGVKIGPYPNNTYIVVNPDGSLFMETNDNSKLVWKHLETNSEWLEPVPEGCVGLPTPNYRQIKYRRMMDIMIGYVDDKAVKIHIMYGQGDIYVTLALADGTPVKYSKGKYSF